ncbi:hypothetical protein FRB97_007182 [Tulasnella sp. 331]|nr:hypothetical protein FRB97_007182 [Tulasnella sp. 331]
MTAPARSDAMPLATSLPNQVRSESYSFSAEDEGDTTAEAEGHRAAKADNWNELVLTDDEAAISCAALGLEGLLEKMNVLLNTSYDLSPERQSLLKICSNLPDFGIAYSLLRPRWDMDPQSAIDNIHARCKEDGDIRKDVVYNDVLIKKYLRPRRLWDLWSNRVVPSWIAFTEPWDREDPFGQEAGQPPIFFAVSHAWLDETGRQSVNTLINGREWPVPIPAATNLEQIRADLLHHNRSYTWLDVLCLRQKSKEEQELVRKEEWTIDIPTIGGIYRATDNVVYYLSGLGLPFQVGDLNSSRHWLNRAWTLQEVKENWRSCVAGSPHLPDDTSGMAIDDPMRTLCDRMDALLSNNDDFRSLFEVIHQMAHRSATTDLDKIAGLNYLLDVETDWRANPNVISGMDRSLPTYVIGESVENAWWRCVNTLRVTHKSEIFFYFPAPGPGKGDMPKWCPSWKELSECRDLLTYAHESSDRLRQCWPTACPCRVAVARIAGFSLAQSKAKDRREGNIKLQGAHEDWPVFHATANHGQSIEDGEYALLIPTGGRELDKLDHQGSSRCVIGYLRHDTKSGRTWFEKATIIDVHEDKGRWARVRITKRNLYLD